MRRSIGLRWIKYIGYQGVPLPVSDRKVFSAFDTSLIARIGLYPRFNGVLGWNARGGFCKRFRSTRGGFLKLHWSISVVRCCPSITLQLSTKAQGPLSSEFSVLSEIEIGRVVTFGYYGE